MPAQKSTPRSKSWASVAQSGYEGSRYRDRSRDLPVERGARPGVREVQARSDPRSARPAARTIELMPDGSVRDDPRWAGPNQTNSGVPKVPRAPGMPSRPRNQLPWRLPRRLPGGPVLDLIDIVDNMARAPADHRPGPEMAPYAILKCVANPRQLPPDYPADSHIAARSGNVNAGDCGLDLQAWEGAPPIDAAQSFTASGDATWITLQGKVNGPLGDPTGRVALAGDRFRYSSVWWINMPVGVPIPDVPPFVPWPGVPLGDEPNPNWERKQPASPAPPNAGEPPVPLLPVDPYGWYPTPSAARNVETQPWAFTGGPGRGGSNPTKPGTREPPGPKTRERKHMSRSARLGYMLFKALDSVSEWAEVVDAIYEALPDDVKKRWSKGRKKRGFIDTAGQYGIDGADWKAQAIWHNLHKVDMSKAVVNIVKNELEDQLYGAIHRKLPKQTGAAVEDGWKVFSDLLGELEALVGL